MSKSSLHRAFDIELLFLANALNIPVSEVTVHWTEIDGKY